MSPSDRRDAHARAARSLADEGDTLDLLVERARHALDGLGAFPESGAKVLVERAVAALEREAARDRAFALWQRWMSARSTKPDAASLLETSRLAAAAGKSRRG